MALDNTIATEPLLNRIIKQEYHNPEDYNFPVTWAIPECSTVTYENDDGTTQVIMSDEMRHLVNTRNKCVVCFKIEFGNSYDGTWKLGIKAMALRLACLNGMCHHQAISGAVLKHTANANYDGVIEAIKQSTQLFIDSEETYNRMVEVKHKETTVMKWFRNYLCFDNQGGKDKVNETQSSILYNTLGKYRSELGGNAWATYNTMTDWATHTPVLEKVNFNPYRNESPVARINDTNRRNNKITKMLTALSKGDNDKFLMTA